MKGNHRILEPANTFMIFFVYANSFLMAVPAVKVYIITESYLVMLTFAASFRSAMAKAEIESKLSYLTSRSLLYTVK